jgi:hypothetical protein
MTAGMIATEPWWTIQEFFPCRYYSTMILHAHLSPGDEKYAR